MVQRNVTAPPTTGARANLSTFATPPRPAKVSSLARAKRLARRCCPNCVRLEQCALMCSFALLLPVEVCCIALLLVTDVLSLGTSALPIPWEWIATTLGVDLALLGLLVGYTVYRNVLCGGRATTTSGGGRGRAGSGEGERPLLDPLGARSHDGVPPGASPPPVCGGASAVQHTFDVSSGGGAAPPPTFDAQQTLTSSSHSKRLGHAVGKSWLTNRFDAAPQVEADYHRYLQRHQLRHVKRRLLTCGLLLVVLGGWSWLWEMLGALGVGRSIGTRWGPASPLFKAAMILLAMFLVLKVPRAARHWPLVVGVAALGTHSLLLWSDTLRPDSGIFEPSDAMDCGEASQLAALWRVRAEADERMLILILGLAFVCLNSCLDYVYCGAVCAAMWLSFIGAGLADVSLSEELHMRARHTTHAEGARAAAVAQVLSSALATMLALGLMLWGARRNNRFERQLFLQSEALLREAHEVGEVIEGKHTQLLALFSNPSVGSKLAAQLQLQPLKFGQEMKYLLRSIPKLYLTVLPAATLRDAGRELNTHKPRIVMFSGHTFMGALAFEDDKGRLDATGAADFAASRTTEFVKMMREVATHDAPPPELDKGGGSDGRRSASGVSSAMACVFLNACQSQRLGHAIASALASEFDAERPLHIICWKTVAEDAAAREFAQGFYDELGASLQGNRGAVPRRLPIAQAFKAASDRFKRAGFCFGDPSKYLHKGNHPHILRPDLENCPGCSPPVHGEVLLIIARPDGRGGCIEYDGDHADTACLNANYGHGHAAAANSSLLGGGGGAWRPRESSLVRGKHGWFVQMGLACASVALISGFIFLLAVLFISRFEEDGEGI